MQKFNDIFFKLFLEKKLKELDTIQAMRQK
jgi:hypothetical protein